MALVNDRQLHKRIRAAGLAAARARSWASSLEQFASGYARALEAPGLSPSRRAA